MGSTVWGENGAMVDLSRESGADGEMLRVKTTLFCYTPNV